MYIVAHTKSTYKTHFICRFRVSDYIYIVAHMKSTYKVLYVDIV
jgi:O-glycosyl hydrolase